MFDRLASLNRYLFVEYELNRMDNLRPNHLHASLQIKQMVMTGSTDQQHELPVDTKRLFWQLRFMLKRATTACMNYLQIFTYVIFRL